MINKRILHGALVAKHPDLMAKLLNHYDITLKWFDTMRVEPAELIDWIAELYNIKHPRQKMTAEHKKKIVQIGKVIYNVLKDDIIYVDGKSKTKYKTWAKMGGHDDYLYLMEQAREMQCRRCGHSEVYEKDGIEYGEDLFADFDYVKDDIYKCHECEAMTRLADTRTDEEFPGLYAQLDAMSEMEYEYVKEVLANYCSSLESEYDSLFIEGHNLDWRNRSGYATIESLDPEELFGVLTVDSEYTLGVYWVRDDTLEVYLSHHDANSRFTVHPGVMCQKSGEVLHGDEIGEAREYAHIFNILMEDDFWEYISKSYFQTYIGSYIDHLEEPLQEIVVELGAKISVSIAENVVKMNELIEG